MKVLSKVLWAVDINEDHTQSLVKISKTAKEYGTEIILLHILDKGFERVSIQSLAKKAVMAELEELAAILRKDAAYEVRLRLEYGNVAERIMDVAEDEDVNMVILNRGTESELEGISLGLNSQKVARSMQKPFVIISEKPASDTPHLLCPVDFSAPSTLALNSAILHARKTGARLSVINVVEPTRITSSRLLKLGISEEEEVEHLLRNTWLQLEKYLMGFDLVGVDLHYEVLTGVPHKEIVRFSKEVDTLYMGSTGKSGLRRAILGSVSEKAIQEASCNMVIVKSEDLFKLHIPTELEDIQKHYDRAGELVGMGYLQDAISQYLQCLSINYLHVPSMWGLASVYERLGNVEKKEYYEDLGKAIMERLVNRKIEEEIRRSLRNAV